LSLFLSIVSSLTLRGGAERFTVNLSGINRSHWSSPVAFKFKYLSLNLSY